MIKNICKYLLFYAGVVLIGTVIFAISFRLPIFKGMSVYVYRALMLLAVVATVMLGVILLIKKHLTLIKIDVKDILLSLCLLVSFLSIFTVIIMSSLDRSISVFILSDMASNPDVVFTRDDVEDRFLDIYVGEYGAMEQRFEEQIVSGNIEKSGDGYKITKNGEFLVLFFRILAKIFPVDEKCIYPPPF